MAITSEYVGTRDLANHFGVQLQVVVRIVDRLGIGHRIGRNRVLSRNEVERVELGLRACGYLPAISGMIPRERRDPGPPNTTD